MFVVGVAVFTFELFFQLLLLLMMMLMMIFLSTSKLLLVLSLLIVLLMSLLLFSVMFAQIADNDLKELGLPLGPRLTLIKAKDQMLAPATTQTTPAAAPALIAPSLVRVFFRLLFFSVSKTT